MNITERKVTCESVTAEHTSAGITINISATLREYSQIQRVDGTAKKNNQAIGSFSKDESGLNVRTNTPDYTLHAELSAVVAEAIPALQTMLATGQTTESVNLNEEEA